MIAQRLPSDYVQIFLSMILIIETKSMFWSTTCSLCKHHTQSPIENNIQTGKLKIKMINLNPWFL